MNTESLIPDASCPVVRNCLLPLRLQVLHQIVQEEVNQNGIDFHLGMAAFDLSLDQLHTPNTARFAVGQLCHVATAMVIENSPLSCISQLPPLGMVSFSLMADASGGLYERQPMVLRICGTR